jgi:hypothetical protein
VDSWFFAFLFPAELVFEFARPEEAKNPSGGNVLHLIQIRLAALSFEKSRGARQAKNRDPIANSSSTNAVNFSSHARFRAAQSPTALLSATASVTAQDDSYTRVTRYQVLP